MSTKPKWKPGDPQKPGHPWIRASKIAEAERKQKVRKPKSRQE